MMLALGQWPAVEGIGGSSQRGPRPWAETLGELGIGIGA